MRCSTRRERASGARDRESRALRVPTLAYRHHCRPPGEAASTLAGPACLLCRAVLFSLLYTDALSFRLSMGLAP